MQTTTLDTVQGDADRYRTHTVDEVAQILGLTPRTVRSYIKRGKIRAVKIGTKWHVTPDNLQRYLQGE